MFNIMQAAAVLGRHSGLIQWANTRLPEAEQALSEVRALVTKHQATFDALVPLLPKVNVLVRDVEAFLKKHDSALKELEKATPEFQQMVDELLPLMVQAQQFAAAQTQEENKNA